MTELRGKPVSDAIVESVKSQIAEMEMPPVLAVLRVGSRPDDLSYERGITKKFESAGALVKSVSLPEDISQADFDAEFDKLNNDLGVNGILMMRPLPKTLSDAHATSTIAADKDVDVMNIRNMAGILKGDKTAHAPATAQAVIEILKFYGIELRGKKVTVIGRSLVIGKPVALLLTNENATVTVCHTKTVNIAEECRSADIIVAAAGSAGMITKDFVKPGQVVIDVGMNVDSEGKLCGDVRYDEVAEIVDAITPVPGGVGAVTTSVILKYTTENAIGR